jgi:hypothetical protein
MSLSKLPKDILSLILQDLEIKDIGRLKTTSKSISKLISQSPKFLLLEGLVQGDENKIKDNLYLSGLKLLDIIDFIIKTKQVSPQTLKYLLSISKKKLTFKILDNIILNLYNDNDVKKWINLKIRKGQNIENYEEKLIFTLINVTAFLLLNHNLIDKNQCSKIRQLLCFLRDRKERSENEHMKIKKIETLVDLSMLPKKELEQWNEELARSQVENLN